jgi:HlyD family secretion protein
MVQPSVVAAPPESAGQPQVRGFSDHKLVGISLAVVGGVLGTWALFWPVPTEVAGTGVLIYPNNAGILDVRSGGQVREIQVRVDERVRRGQC